MQDFFLKASYYCSLSEHCIQKVREKLVQWETPKEFIDPIIDKLLEDDYINEERFARAFVKDKFRFNHWGRIKISTHLRALGISSENIATAMQEIDDEEYAKMLDEIVEKKRKSIKNGTDYEIRAKLLRHALSRGFEYDLVASKLNI
jgi:regulatory protein